MCTEISSFHRASAYEFWRINTFLTISLLMELNWQKVKDFPKVNWNQNWSQGQKPNLQFPGSSFAPSAIPMKWEGHCTPRLARSFSAPSHPFRKQHWAGEGWHGYDSALTIDPLNPPGQENPPSAEATSHIRDFVSAFTRVPHPKYLHKYLFALNLSLWFEAKHYFVNFN